MYLNATDSFHNKISLEVNLNINTEVGIGMVKTLVLSTIFRQIYYVLTQISRISVAD